MSDFVAINLQVGKQMALRKDLIKGVWPRDGQDYWVVETQEVNYKISKEEAGRIIPILTDGPTDLPPVTLKDLEPISDAWALVDQLSPMSIYDLSHAQSEALIAEHKAVENLLFPPRINE